MAEVITPISYNVGGKKYKILELHPTDGAETKEHFTSFRMQIVDEIEQPDVTYKRRFWWHSVASHQSCCYRHYMEVIEAYTVR
ncbi:conserved hypothetical protein [Ricinus communis]|uniref:Uncharacterized protein n=1 Tax=Ricinus communis TaxID=3988 RepID=B9RL66_RICCO|nr:conserved hypothetical protein [Ricinus communis]